MIKTLNKVRIERTYFNITKAIYKKPTASIFLNGEKQSFSSMVRDKTRMSTLTTVIQHSTGRPSLSRQHKQIKAIQIGKEEAKFSLFAHDMILYTENPKDSTEKLLEMIHKFSKVTGYSTYRNLLHFYTPITKQQKEKSRNQSHLQYTKNH